MISVWVSIRIEFPCLLPHYILIPLNISISIWNIILYKMCIYTFEYFARIARETIHNIIYKTPYRFAGKSTS